MEKAELIRAGLAPRKLGLFEYGDSGQFHDDVMAVFLKLAEGGGYELLRITEHYVSFLLYLVATLLSI